ncbi:MAG: hypothetical protein U0175_35030 [Caldilineaceae bacterium]
MKQKELLTLAQQASYLPERLAGNWQPAPGSQPQQMGKPLTTVPDGCRR